MTIIEKIINQKRYNKIRVLYYPHNYKLNTMLPNVLSEVFTIIRHYVIKQKKLYILLQILNNEVLQFEEICCFLFDIDGGHCL